MISQIIGWSGSIILLVGFYLMSRGKIEGRSRVFQATQLVGSLGVGFNAFAERAWPAFAVESVWAIIALTALLSIIRKKGQLGDT